MVQTSPCSLSGRIAHQPPQLFTQAGQQVQIDIGMFTNWVNAFAHEDLQLAEFYMNRFRDEFKPAFEAWMATDPVNNPDAPETPFSMPEYQLDKAAEADRLEKEAEATFAEGTAANETSDKYILNTVFLASVLFLGGIATRFKAMSARWVIILFSLAILIFGLINLLTYPVI